MIKKIPISVIHNTFFAFTLEIGMSKDSKWQPNIFIF